MGEKKKKEPTQNIWDWSQKLSIHLLPNYSHSTYYVPGISQMPAMCGDGVISSNSGFW
jgi:hypothetical protein